MKWSGHDSYATPDYLYKSLDMEFGFNLDPCPLNEHWTVDGLELDWTGRRVFCNPPWSNITPWVVKAFNSSAEIVVFLLPARTDTGWFHMLSARGAEIRLFRKRVHFIRDASLGITANPTDGTMVAVVRGVKEK